MEIMCLICRDSETGEIWEHIGGQEPRKLSADEVEFRKLDISTIPVRTSGETKKVICPNCGSAVEKTAFCSVCGENLENL